jgi:hypothetical protein
MPSNMMPTMVVNMTSDVNSFVYVDAEIRFFYIILLSICLT